jgi:hypothetical protein
MINFTLLDENQKIWLNRYNQIIRGKVSKSEMEFLIGIFSRGFWA